MQKMPKKRRSAPSWSSDSEACGNRIQSKNPLVAVANCSNRGTNGHLTLRLVSLCLEVRSQVPIAIYGLSFLGFDAGMFDIDFQCTKCGECCRGFRLPLSVEEAVCWLRDGNSVDVLCQAIPWIDEPPASDHAAAYQRGRSFSAMSGAMPIRVIVTLAAPLRNRCPNLSADNQCKIYERRPGTCRTYPAELNPLLQLMPQQRRCPPEAWQPGGTPLIRNGAYVNSELVDLIRGKLEQPARDAPMLAELCRKLGVGVAAMANEGYAAYSPTNAELLGALRSEKPFPAVQSDWTFISNKFDTVEAILSCDANCVSEKDFVLAGFKYLSLFDKPTI
jgi:Fe-S-cluster containining protein